MPGDEAVQLLNRVAAAVSGTMTYRCQCGMPYLVGNCGSPVEQLQCPSANCPYRLGGQTGQTALGSAGSAAEQQKRGFINMLSLEPMTAAAFPSFKKHSRGNGAASAADVSGAAGVLAAAASGVRDMPASCCQLLRLLVHAALAVGSAAQLQPPGALSRLLGTFHDAEAQSIVEGVVESLDVSLDPSYRRLHLPTLFRSILPPTMDALAASFWMDPQNAARFPVTSAVLQERQQQRLVLLPQLTSLVAFERAFRRQYSGILSRRAARSSPLSILLVTRTLQHFEFQGEAFFNSATLLHEVGARVPQQVVTHAEAAELATALLDQLPPGTAPASILPHLEVLLTFVKQTGGTPSTSIADYITAWLPEGQTAKGLLLGCGLLQRVQLQQLLALYESVEDAVAAAVGIEASIGTRYKQPLSLELTQKVLDMPPRRDLAISQAWAHPPIDASYSLPKKGPVLVLAMFFASAGTAAEGDQGYASHRDRARLLQLQQGLGYRAYSFDLDHAEAEAEGGQHVQGNFNSHRGARDVAARFAGVEFSAIFLDYFRVPSGYAAVLYKPQLFTQFIPELVKAGAVAPGVRVYIPNNEALLKQLAGNGAFGSYSSFRAVPGSRYPLYVATAQAEASGDLGGEYSNSSEVRELVEGSEFVVMRFTGGASAAVAPVVRGGDGAAGAGGGPVGAADDDDDHDRDQDVSVVLSQEERE
eukprot:gene8301-8486_t